MTKNMNQVIKILQPEAIIQYIKDVIAEDYKHWEPPCIILLKSPTGTGKTSFCLLLAEYARQTGQKIVYLASRTAKINEFMQDSEHYADVFIYVTYQKLEQYIVNGADYYLDQIMNCKYIFADECHYFTEDIGMPNSNASISETWLRKNTTNSIKIYASATCDNYCKFLKRRHAISENCIYDITKDLSYVTNCYLYQYEDTMSIIDKIIHTEPNSKILFFVHNTAHMEQLLQKYGYDIADYLCSKNTSDTYLRKICNLTNNDSIAINKRILFATKTIDIGINIIDKQLKYIFCEMPDPETITQCLGRKRNIDKNDTCTFFICDHKKEEMIKHINVVNRHIKKYREYKKNPEEFIKKYRYDANVNKGGSVFIMLPGSSKLFIDTNKVNKYINEMNMYYDIVKDGYLKALKKRMDPGLSRILKRYEDTAVKVVAYLEKIKGRKFYGEDRREISEYFSNIIKGKRTFGIKIINSWLDENISYLSDIRLEVQKDKRRRTDDGQNNPYRDQVYWTFDSNGKTS